MTPFIPFPLFPPYEHWWPNRYSDFPNNEHVRERLSAIDPISKPFINLWYCELYLRRQAHTWIPSSALDSYRLETSLLTKMLNWSFFSGTSLIDWSQADIDSYIAHALAPPVNWLKDSSVSRFIPEGCEFSNWPINPGWRPYRNIGHAFSSLKILYSRTNRFFDFYRKEVGSQEAESAGGLLSAAKVSVTVFTRHEISWCLEEIDRLEMSQLRKKMYCTYFALALHCKGSERKLVGSSTCRAMLNLFSKKNGMWYEAPDGVKGLDFEFSKIFEEYLAFLGLDIDQPLPEQPLFECRINCSLPWRTFRAELSERAANSFDESIKATHHKWLKLTFSRIRASIPGNDYGAKPRGNPKARRKSLLRAVSASEKQG